MATAKPAANALSKSKRWLVLIQILKEEIVGALFAVAISTLKAVQLQPLLDADIVIARRFDRATPRCSDAISQLPPCLLVERPCHTGGDADSGFLKMNMAPKAAEAVREDRAADSGKS